MGHIFSFSGAPKIRISASAIFYCVLLSWLFVTVYGGCNRVTHLRGDVGVWMFEWERLIPFVSFMVIPYMSIDFFFGLSPFLCASTEERRLLAARISFGILAAGAIYCLLPLRLVAGRGYPEGVIGSIWNAFLAVDMPYNLFPSLHMTLRSILADTYAKHTSGWWRIASHTWFSLIGFSTVLTHQHQVVDIVAGFGMATFCFYIFQPVGWESPVSSNKRVGFLYAAGGLAAGWLAPVLWSGGFFLLWAGISMGLIAGGYFVWGPAVFRKRDGVLPLSSRVLLAPVLMGQRLSLWHYSRQCRPWDHVTGSVWIGRVLNNREAERAVTEGLTAVLDLTGEFSESRILRSLSYKNIQVLDMTAPTQDQLDEAVEFVRKNGRCGRVLIHCKIGYSRSVAVVASYLLSDGLADNVEGAFRKIREVRPSVVIRPEVLGAVSCFARRMASGGDRTDVVPGELVGKSGV